MNPKPTYDELEQKVKALDLEVAKRQQAEDALQEIEMKKDALIILKNFSHF